MPKAWANVGQSPEGMRVRETNICGRMWDIRLVRCYGPEDTGEVREGHGRLYWLRRWQTPSSCPSV